MRRARLALISKACALADYAANNLGQPLPYSLRPVAPCENPLRPHFAEPSQAAHPEFRLGCLAWNNGLEPFLSVLETDVLTIKH